MSVMQGDALEQFVRSMSMRVILVDVQDENSSGVVYRVELPKLLGWEYDKPESTFTIGYIEYAGKYGWTEGFTALDAWHEVVDGKIKDLDAATESVVRAWATEDGD